MASDSSDDSGIFHRSSNAKRIVIGGDSSEEDSTGGHYSPNAANALLLAVTTSNAEGLVKLLAAKAEPNCEVDENGSVALHHAVLAGSAECAEILLLSKVRILDDVSVCGFVSSWHGFTSHDHTTRLTQMQLTQILSRH